MKRHRGQTFRNYGEKLQLNETGSLFDDEEDDGVVEEEQQESPRSANSRSTASTSRHRSRSREYDTQSDAAYKSLDHNGKDVGRVDRSSKGRARSSSPSSSRGLQKFRQAVRPRPLLEPTGDVDSPPQVQHLLHVDLPRDHLQDEFTKKSKASTSNNYSREQEDKDTFNKNAVSSTSPSSSAKQENHGYQQVESDHLEEAATGGASNHMDEHQDDLHHGVDDDHDEDGEGEAIDEGFHAHPPEEEEVEIEASPRPAAKKMKMLAPSAAELERERLCGANELGTGRQSRHGARKHTPSAAQLLAQQAIMAGLKSFGGESLEGAQEGGRGGEDIGAPTSDHLLFSSDDQIYETEHAFANASPGQEETSNIFEKAGTTSSGGAPGGSSTEENMVVNQRHKSKSSIKLNKEDMASDNEDESDDEVVPKNIHGSKMRSKKKERLLPDDDDEDEEPGGLGQQDDGAFPTIPAGVTLDEGVNLQEDVDAKALRKKESRMQTACENLLAREQWETDNILAGQQTSSTSAPRAAGNGAHGSRVRGAAGARGTTSSRLGGAGGAFGGAGGGLDDSGFFPNEEDDPNGGSGAPRTGGGGGRGRDPNAGPRLVRAMNMRDSTFLVGIKRPALRRLARRGGVRRVSYDTYPIFRETFNDLLSEIVFDVNVMLDHTGRQTVTARDVINVIARRGVKILGGEH
ncbi:unnamed protein product [Amoebophrya sp. A25]|nr:unnamed protein product [Amoebophrya sp. A25]|eukprot:GSA25T00026466001.1